MSPERLSELELAHDTWQSVFGPEGEDSAANQVIDLGIARLQLLSTDSTEAQQLRCNIGGLVQAIDQRRQTAAELVEKVATNFFI